MATTVELVAKRAATALVFLVTMLADGDALVAGTGEGGEECGIVHGMPLHVQLNNGINGTSCPCDCKQLFVDAEEPRDNTKGLRLAHDRRQVVMNTKPPAASLRGPYGVSPSHHLPPLPRGDTTVAASSLCTAILVPRIGFGSAGLRHATEEAVSLALTAGYRHLDTAQVMGFRLCPLPVWSLELLGLC